MNFYNAIKYFQYLIHSGHNKGHGIHSPFIFDLVSRVFRNKNGREVVLRIEKIRKRLLRDRRLIEVHDLGAGGNKSNLRTRKVSEIARYSAVPAKYGVLLGNLASEFGKKPVIELGTSFGLSTMYMAASCESTVYTIEGCSSCAGIARGNFSEAGLKNVVLLTGSFDTVLPELAAKSIKPGMVFIDGNHRKEAVLKYFSELSSISGEDTVFVFDDIYYSREMAEAWEEIISSENVSASIDIFRMGIVFLKPNITRNHYIISY
ncbi:MAG TPA: class I SAM-dependent methyltransferase [Bacteroidales bacterium]|nr:class I SAM-dependent methyltransferase [Bacteroidales bacterium]